MKKQFLFISTLCLHFISGQTGINTSTPNSSSVLDINGINGNQGVLLPKVNLVSIVDATTIPSPAKGLTVFNSNGLIGEGIYVNEGTTTAPLWQKMKLLQPDELSRAVSTLAYPGATTNAARILNTDTFQWRLVSSGTNFILQMRLRAAPTADVVTTPTYTLNWKNTQQVTTSIPGITWTAANWSTWQNIYTYATEFESMFYFGVLGTEKLFRVNVFASTDVYNYLMVEQF